MTTVTSLISANLVPAIGLTIFLAVATATMAFGHFVGRESTLRRRALQPYVIGDQNVLLDRRSLGYSNAVTTAQMLSRAAARFAPGEERHVGSLRHQLRSASFLDPNAVGIFYAARFMLGFGIPVAFLILYPFFVPTAPLFVLVLLTVLGAFIGFYLPSLYLSRRLRRIQEQHRLGFPDLLDLLVVCTEAGIGIESAIDRVGRELALSYPHLATQIYLLNLELRAGRSFPEALERFAGYLGIEEARSFATLIQQSQELGTSLVDALRVYSDEMRDKRLARAEEKAHALPAKLVLPLGLCIFPVMLVVTMMPVVIRLAKVFFAE